MLDNNLTKVIIGSRRAGKELRCKNLLMITEDKEGEEKIEWFGDKAVIRFLSLWKWLLNTNQKD